jgi:hypothetical protein
MQAATIALNLMTTGTSMPVVALGNSCSNGVAQAGSFAQTLAKKVEPAQAPQNADPSATQNDTSGSQLAHQSNAEPKLAGRSTKPPKSEAETQKRDGATHGYLESAPGSNADVSLVVSPLPEVVSPGLEGVGSSEQLYEGEVDGNASPPTAASAATNHDSVEQSAPDEGTSVSLELQKALADTAAIADSVTSSTGSTQADRSSALKATEQASLLATDVLGADASEPQRGTPGHKPGGGEGAAQPVTEPADLVAAAIATESSATQATTDPAPEVESALLSIESNPSGVERNTKASTEEATLDSKSELPLASITATSEKTNWSHTVSPILTIKVDESRNSSSQNADSPNAATETVPSGQSRAEETSSDSKPFTDPKPTNEAQLTVASGAPLTMSANSAGDVAANGGSLVTNPLVNEHTMGQAGSKDETSLTSTAQGQDPGPVTDASPLNDTSGVTNLQISGNAAQSEVHLTMQGDRLGSVELHARVAGEQVGAAIVVEKRDTHAALSLELPALREALSEKNLRVEQIWLTQSTLESTAGDARNAYGQQSRQRHGAQFGAGQEQENFASLQAGAAEAEGIFDERGRLSVLA